MKHAHSVCVFGAGPAGAAAALRLADLSVDCVMLDRPSAKKSWGGESLTGAIREPLTALGLWESFSAAGHVQGFEQRTTWGSAEPDTKDSIFSRHGNFWHVDRARFDADLRGGVETRGIPILTYKHLSEIRRIGDEWLVRIDDREISARYIVDATGRACAVGRKLGVRPQLHDRLIAFTTVVPRNSRFDHAMVIEAMPEGWWYAAPVPKGHVLAFFTDADLARPELPRSLKTCAANSAFSAARSGEGWLPVGDAFAAHDPLCGWGVYRAMTNGIRAGEAIARFLKSADEGPIEKYFELCREQFSQYLEGLRVHYSYEKRWADSPFWERRRSKSRLKAAAG
jgi:flavin-dependent dehydrogenase